MRRGAIDLRTTLLIVVLGLPAIALLLFGPRGTTDTPPDRTVVRYWEKWSGVEALAMQQIVDEFNATIGAEHAIYVEYNAISMIDQRTLIATAGGDPPDIAGLYDYIVPQFAERDALLPLDELSREFGVQLDQISPVWLDICRYDNTLYTLPAPPYTVALYYNKTMFRDAGLDPNRPPPTIAELDAYNRVLSLRDETGALTQVGFSPTFLGWWPWIWPKYFGAELWDGMRFDVTSDAALAGLNWLSTQRLEYGVADLTRFEDRYAGLIEGVQNPFLSGRVAMLHQGPWISNWIRKYTPDLDYGVAAFPSSDADRTHAFASTDVLAIPRGARHPREAMRFLAYVMRQDVMERLCAAHCKPSPFKTPLPGFYRNHPNPHIEVFQKLSAAPDVFMYPEMPTWSFAAAQMLNAVVAIQRGDAPAERAAQAEERVNENVANYRKMRALRGDEDA